MFEDRFLRFCDDHRLPRPEINAKVAGYRVDALWRAQRLIVELDSREFHDHDQPFEHHRDKDVDLLAAGHSVVRMTWTRMTRRADREAGRLRRLLTERGGSS